MHLITLFKTKLFRTYRLGICAGVLALSTLNMGIVAHVQADDHCHHHHPHNDAELGIALETEFWNLVQEHDIPGYSEKLSRIFQGSNSDGIYTREEQIVGLVGAKLESFVLADPVTTRHHDILVFSYNFRASGSNLVSGPSITVWKKSGCHWKIVSHSYFPG